ncbi:MAG TPA: hypothetical protein VFD12_08650 [Oligella sp.]|nr:hypothetical protein [Oligella sp.]
MKKVIYFLIATLPLNALAYDRTPEGGIATINLCAANNLMTNAKRKDLYESIVLQDFNGKPSSVNHKDVDDKTKIMLQMFKLRDLRGLCHTVYNDYNLSEDQKIKIKSKRKEVESNIKNLEGSARSGSLESQYKIALSYIESNDVNNAVSWLYKAAQQGHVDAQYRLADILSTGMWGYPADEKKALYWFKEAYKGGDSSEYNIAHVYYYLTSESKDNLMEALAWYLVVQKNNKNNEEGGIYSATTKNINKLNNKLSVGERERAQEMSNLYIRRIL